MSDTLNVTAATQEEAHRAVLQVNAHAKAMVANGERVRITCGEDVEDITTKQRGFLHAAVLPQIAEQYTFPDGTRYTADIWKEFFRKRFLPDRYELRRAIRWDPKLCALVQAKRKTPHAVRQSTEDLGVRRYSEYIDMVLAAAVTELGVVFEFRAGEREAVRYVRVARRPIKSTEEAYA